MEKWPYNRSGNRPCDDMCSQCIMFGTTSGLRPEDHISGCWSGRWDFLSHPPWRDSSGRRQYRPEKAGAAGIRAISEKQWNFKSFLRHRQSWRPGSYFRIVIPSGIRQRHSDPELDSSHSRKRRSHLRKTRSTSQKCRGKGVLDETGGSDPCRWPEPSMSLRWSRN